MLEDGQHRGGRRERRTGSTERLVPPTVHVFPLATIVKSRGCAAMSGKPRLEALDEPRSNNWSGQVTAANALVEAIIFAAKISEECGHCGTLIDRNQSSSRSRHWRISTRLRGRSSQCRRRYCKHANPADFKFRLRGFAKATNMAEDTRSDNTDRFGDDQFPKSEVQSRVFASWPLPSLCGTAMVDLHKKVT